MTELTYSFRRAAFAPTRTYFLENDALTWRNGRNDGRAQYGDVTQVRFVEHETRRTAAVIGNTTIRIVLQRKSGSNVTLSPLHSLRFRTWENRSSNYLPFARELIRRIKIANPQVGLIAAQSWQMRLKRAVGRRTEPIVGSIAAWTLRSIRHLDPDRISDLAGGFMRAVGPLLPEHRIGRANLAAAYPEKSATQIGTILGGAWENLGRIAAEFPHLDRLWDFQLDSSLARRIEFDPGSIERLLQLRDDGKPALLFSAHLANWELLARVSESCGLEGMILYRRARMAKLDSAISEMRSLKMAHLIPAAVHAPLKIAHALKHGMHVGMLVDQYDIRGVDVTFFGRPTKASPLIARLARLVDCPIHGIRIIRLPGHRFRAELTDAVAPVRQVDGKIDVAGTMQAITSVIEGWVRDHPEQWLWQHRRWR